MTYEMRLHKEPFEQIKRGQKTIELRLNDEKRRLVKVGDCIVFRETDHPDHQLTVKVIALHSFPTFRELYETLPLLACGYTPDNIDSATPEDMDAYYSPERQKQYGVLGIELELIGNC